jgi:hypothetical protein
MVNAGIKSAEIGFVNRWVVSRFCLPTDDPEKNHGYVGFEKKYLTQ